MSGKTVLWLPGTDHAGIATQIVAEKHLWKTQGKTRRDIGKSAPPLKAFNSRAHLCSCAIKISATLELQGKAQPGSIWTVVLT